MPQHTHEPARNDIHSPIEVHFSDLTLDFGMAAIPKLLARFWIYLSSQGQTLNDRQFALLMQVLILRDTQDFELRVTNLPMMSSPITLERDKTELRRMGLVFTERLYYPLEPGSNPVMRAQRWDLRSLFYNLEQVARLWLEHQQGLVMKWEQEGRPGCRPIYSFSPGFTHEVRLPREVALDIVNGKLFPVPPTWLQAAETLLSHPEAQDAERTRPETSGTGDVRAVVDARTGRNTSGADGRTRPETSGAEALRTGLKMSGTVRTRPETRGHLLEDEEERGGGIDSPQFFGNVDLSEQVFAHFAARKGDPAYQPLPKERAALEQMLTDGYTFEQIIAWIEYAFALSKKPRHFTFVAILARQALQESHSHLPATRQPETRSQPETRTEAESDADLREAMDIYRSTGRELTPDVLARLNRMAANCDQAAQREGVNGGKWLAEALEAALGVAQPDRLLNYASAVLGDWVTNGRPGRTKAVTDTPEVLEPELEVFQQATGGRLPLPDQRQIVIQAIRERGYTADALRPFWEAWVGRDKKRTDLDWLLDWAAKGVVLPASGFAKPEPTPQFKSLPALQNVSARYGGTQHE